MAIQIGAGTKNVVWRSLTLLNNKTEGTKLKNKLRKLDKRFCKMDFLGDRILGLGFSFSLACFLALFDKTFVHSFSCSIS